MNSAKCTHSNSVTSLANRATTATGTGSRTSNSRSTSGSRCCFRSAAPPQSSLNRRDLLGAASALTAMTTASNPVLAAAGPSSSSSSPMVAAASVAAAPSTTITSPPTEADPHGRYSERLKLLPKGWNTWKWRNHNINWLSAGEKGPVVILIHGFGASVYHWRYLVPELSKTCRVYALDVLGFGWSDKAVVDYDGYGIWTDQIADFIKDVVQPGCNGNGGNGSTGALEKAVLVGNSLGGYNSLATAAAHPDLVKGVVLLNAAGRFEDPAEAGQGDETAAPAADAAAAVSQVSLLQRVTTSVSTAIKRAAVSASFIYAKQPARVKQVLGQVYVDKTNIDDDLVDSILIPAQDPAASEVFYRVITARGTPVNRLLDQFEDKMPLLLLWGSADPWCVPARATQIENHYKNAERINILSGHCPHDDTPGLVAGPLDKWVQGLEA
jgi:pimeloyl-ACP methyl ester carboxylesterase